MGKKKKKAASARSTLGGVAGGLVSNLAQELLSDGAERLLNMWTGGKDGKKDKEKSLPADAGLLLLLAMEDRRSRRVSDLIAGVGRRAGVFAAMEALRSARELDLVRPIGKAGARVRLTRLGRETAEAVRACLAKASGKKKKNSPDAEPAADAPRVEVLEPAAAGQNGA